MVGTSMATTPPVPKAEFHATPVILLVEVNAAALNLLKLIT